MTIETFTYQDPYPSGTVVVFTGEPYDLPNGWVMCDGNNGTMDLRDTFPKTVPNATTDAGTTGGNNFLSLTASHLPSHDHSASTNDTAGSHNHEVWYGENLEQPGGGYDYADYIDSGGMGGSVAELDDGGHSHGMNLNDAFSGNSIDNQPNYSEQIYMMKL